jgi:hypothetical protein
MDSGQPGLTCQIYDPDYKIMITPNKTNRNKLWAQFPINLILKNEIKKITKK